MKKLIFSCVVIAALSSVAFFVDASKQIPELTPAQLANIEALAKGDDYSGKPCYVNGEYNADWPETLVCDSPCKMKPWKPSLFPTLSYCL